MASLHLCSPLTLHLSAEQHRAFLKTSPPSFFRKHSNQLNLNNSCLSFSSSPSHNPILPVSIGDFNNLVLHFSCTTQDAVVEIVESQTNSERGKEEEEFSRTRLLAQNVPWTCTAEDIRALFEKFGTVLDVELSMHNGTRNRGLAFVTMGSPEEADNARQNLESFEFHGRHLKMNYAKLRRKKFQKPPRPPQIKPPPTFNLFVSNLPFDAKAKDMKEFFDAQGANIVSAEIVYNVKPRRPAGYGFVAFKTKKEADDAISTFSGKEFKGRLLRIARSKQFAREQRKEVVQSDASLTELDSKLEQRDEFNN